MFSAFVLTVMFAPPILAAVLRKTAFWWAPAVALLVGGMLPFTQLDTTSHGEDAALAGLGNAGLMIAGLCLLAYGAILLAITASVRRMLRRPAPPPPPPALPVARVVAVSKS